MKLSTTKRHAYTLLGVLLFFTLWFLISGIIGEKTLVFPSPIETFAYLFSLLGKAFTYQCLGVSFLKTVIGFAIAFVLAAILGLLAGRFERMKLILAPTISVLKAIPTVAVVFLFLVMVGVKKAPVLMVILIAFPILYESFAGGVENIDKEIIAAARVDGSNAFTSLFKITIPQIFPFVVVGMASSFSLSFKVEIMAEIVSGDTGAGLGAAILYAQRNDPADMRPIFAYSFVAVFFIFAISLALKAIENVYRKKIG